MNRKETAGPTSHSFISQRLRLNYFDWGNADAPTLILLHGGRDHARSWDWVAAELRRDWHVIAPDLRGHGESAWSPDGAYMMPYFIYDLAQLIHQQPREKVAIVAHSLGAMIALRYAGLYPEKLSHLVAVEGFGGMPKRISDRPLVDRLRGWIDERRALSGRLPRRYASIESAAERMQSENAHLTAEQAWHLTVHGVDRNEDGTYSWKFDNYVRTFPPYELGAADLHALWARIECPVLLAFGRQSWTEDPREDGTASHFRDVRVEAFDPAGHWLHHDQTARFLDVLRDFL